MIRRRFGAHAVDMLDLSIPKTRLFRLFFGKVFRCRQVVLLGGPRSLSVFLILLWVCGKLPTTTMVAIGGWLGDLARRNWLIRSVALPRVAHIFVQTSLIRDAVLRHASNSRISIMPNFNISIPIPIEDPDRFVRNPVRLLFLSQILRAKGVFLAIEATRALQQRAIPVTLDIFGPCGEEGIEDALMSSLGPDIHYKGVVPAERVIECMAGYDILVFPTFYEGEGFPGVILDAFWSGTPIVCSDWRSNSELVSDGRTGLVVSLDKAGAFVSALLRLIEDRDLLCQISGNARREARKYHSETAAAEFLEHLAARISSSPEPVR